MQLTSIHIGTYSLCSLRRIALLLDSMQNVNQFKVNERTSGTLFLTAVLISAMKVSRHKYHIIGIVKI